MWNLVTRPDGSQKRCSLQRTSEKGVEIRTFPPEVIDELRKLTKEVINELAEKDPFTKKVYASYYAFQEKANKYSNIAEKAFYNNLQADLS